MQRLIPVHVGLFGHVDHGKTELARALSEKISTAGLDRHPEAKRRQMSIDLGFTAFTLGNYLVTLVDVPGHAALIRTAVSGASIIDAAILVVSAAQGPQIQTGEHLILLESLGLPKVLVALSNIDLVDASKIDAAKDSVDRILSESAYRGSPIVPVSSITKQGLPELKEVLLSQLSPPRRLVDGKFKMPIDHAFPIKGVGTVATGTIVRGKVRMDDIVEITPPSIECRVKSIQTFGTPRQMAEAGDRAGLALQGVDYRSICRGYYLSSPKSLRLAKHLIAKARINLLFKHEISPGLLMHVTVGMSSIQAKVFPFRTSEEGQLVATSAPREGDFTLYMQLDKPAVAEKGDRILLSLLSLPPTSLRIAAGGVILDTPIVPPKLQMIDEKTGVISRLLQGSKVIVGGLAKSKIGAQRVVDRRILTESGLGGIVTSTFGNKGMVEAKFDQTPIAGERVFLKTYRELKVT